ncbi:hypothetical protein IWX90DRAFT_101221 [Phyllosticta citrichinensis]|uniref:Uncharacterized protein n=1 Tax=Phyllosticta citrichinensis TaxID=1130410 RepID=A0ABR1Y2I8_9PEZI
MNNNTISSSKNDPQSTQLSAEVVIGIVGLVLMVFVPLIGCIFRKRIWQRFGGQPNKRESSNPLYQVPPFELRNLDYPEIPRPIRARQGGQQTILPLYSDDQDSETRQLTVAFHSQAGRCTRIVPQQRQRPQEASDREALGHLNFGQPPQETPFTWRGKCRLYFSMLLNPTRRP